MEMVMIEIIVFLAVAALVIFLLVLIYSGLFTSIRIETGAPPIASATVAYKFARGPYKECGKLFDQTAQVAPDLRCFGVYYDDPRVTAPKDQRYAVGAILAENDLSVDPKLNADFLRHGFKIYHFPRVEAVVKTTFPFMNMISIYIAVFRVYSALTNYIDDKQLKADPCLEIYDGSTIHFMAPLSKHDAFYVPESR